MTEIDTLLSEYPGLSPAKARAVRAMAKVYGMDSAREAVRMFTRKPMVAAETRGKRKK